MVMSSQQIAGMLQQQNAMFGGIASYAQQITPPMGGAPGMGMGVMPQYSGGGPLMFNQGPAPMPPPMPMQSAWNPGMMGGMAMPFGPPHAGGVQAMGESILGSGFAGLNTATQGLGAMAGVAGLAGAGLGMLGVGGGLATGLAVAGSAPVALGLGAAAHGASNMYTGFQQRQGVNQVLRSRFGNVMGVGRGTGGSGFSTGEMGAISGMLREMGTEDLTTNMEELTRVMDKTAGMGLYRGVQSAREFKQKFQSTVDSLKEISEIMHTTLEGATQFLGQARGMGFFTGQDISKQLAATRVMSSMTGMSIDQTTQMAQQGAQMARATGGRGRQGAQAGLMAGGRVAMAQSLGLIDDDTMAFATGGLTGAEGAQAFSGRMQQTSMRFMQRGAGRAMVAGLWDPTSGGISQERLNAAMTGETDIRDLLRQGRRSIRETGGRRSEFFRDEDQLRNQVLAQGGEYLPMAIYGTHLAQRRGLSMDDPIVQRQMRRRFRMSQGEVEAATKMMQNMPEIQANMITKGRLIRDQEELGARKEMSGITGLGRRLGRVWEREVENPFRQFADDMTTDVTKGIEGIVSTMEGRITTQMSDASKQLIMERSEFGRTVGGAATRAAQFGQGDYQKFMRGTSVSASYSRQQDQSRVLGQMLGMRADADGRGQMLYEQSFDVAGSALAGAGKIVAGAASFVGRAGMGGAGLLGIETPSILGGITGDAGDVSLFKGSDVALGLRSLAKDTGIEGFLNEARGYDPKSMTRAERAKALGFDPSKDKDMVGFLKQQSAAMKRDLGYTEDEQKRLGEAHAELLYSRLAHSKERSAWQKSYQRGFGGVSNILYHAERRGSPELRAAAKKARQGTKAEQVAFVRMLEQKGDVTKSLRVTDELSRTVGEDVKMYEMDIEKIRSRRESLFEGLESATTIKGKSEGRQWLAGAARKGLAGAVAGAAVGGIAGGLIGGFADPLGIGEAVGDWIEEEEGGISGEEMERFLADEDTRADFLKFSSADKTTREAARRRLQNAAEEGRMSKSAAETWRRVQDTMKEGGKGAAILKQIAISFDAEDYRARSEVEQDFGRKLSSALGSVNMTALGKEGKAAYEKLKEVARLRASKDPEDRDESFRLENELMESITGTQASKDLRKALRGKEGAEFVLAGLEGAEGVFAQFGGGKGGRRMNTQAKVSNILQTMLRTEGVELAGRGLLEAMGAKSAEDITKAIARGGPGSQEVIGKLLSTIEKSGDVKGDRMKRLRERVQELGTSAEDRDLSQEEIAKMAGGLGGRFAGQARAKASAEKVATADGQSVANKHLATMSAAIRLMANKQGLVELSPDSIAKLSSAVKKGGAKAGSE